jgi:predicted small secreted protein
VSIQINVFLLCFYLFNFYDTFVRGKNMSKLLYHIYLTLLLSGIILTACNQKNGEGDATMKQANSSELSELGFSGSRNPAGIQWRIR